MDKTSESYAKRLLAELAIIKEAIADAVLPSSSRTEKSDTQDDSPGTGQRHSQANSLGGPIAPHKKPSQSHNSKSNQSRSKKFGDIIAAHKPILELIGLVVLIVYTTVSALQWVAMKSQIRTSEEATQKQLRAFLYVDKTEISGNGTGPYFLSTKVRNGGSTPARNAFAMRTTLELIPNPKAQNATDPIPDVKVQSEVPFGLMPPQGDSSIIFPISQGVIDSIRQPAIYGMTVTGDIEYEDIFGNHHITEFCQEYKATGIDEKGRQFYFGSCNHHNCDDESCTDYNERKR